MKVIVSACLLGRNCKYNGGNNFDEGVTAFLEGKEVIPVCPEELAGLGVPRVPMEIVNGVLINRDGVTVDAPVRTAVAQILKEIQDQPIECAILKSRSPTCGVRQVYDGTFTGTLTDGNGTLAQALIDKGYTVLSNEDIQSFISKGSL